MDWGLLQGIGEGLKGAVSGYQDQRNFGIQQALMRRQQQAQDLTQGFQTDDQGNLSFTPEMQIQKNLQAQQAKDKLDEMDPDSTRSKTGLLAIKSSLNSVKPGLGDQTIQDGMSLSDAKEISGNILKPVISGNYGMMGRQMSNDRMQQNVDLKRDALTERQNINATNAGQAYEKDPILHQLKNTTNSLNRALSIANGDTPVTAQNFNMLQQDLINAVAPGGVATEHKVDRELVDTLASKLNEVKSKFGDIQDLRTAQPQVFKQLKDLMNQVKQDYSQAMSDQAKNIHDSYSVSTNPKVQQVNDLKFKNYSQNAQGLMQPTPDNVPASAHPQDSVAIQWAKAHPDDPRAIQILKVNGVQ